MKYRKKPVVIEAMQLRPLENEHLVMEWLSEEGAQHSYNSDYMTLAIETLEGTMTAHMGDYIIKGVHGEFYPCKPDIFEKTYEAVE